MLPTPGHDGTVTLPPLRGPSDLVRDWSSNDKYAACRDASDITRIREAPGALLAFPEHYEPAYAYPLLIWLPDESQSEDEAAFWLARISLRNQIALGLRPALFAAGRRSGLERLRYILRSLERDVLIHPQRRYLAGTGAGGRTAVEWLIQQPRLFAGVVAIDVDAQPVFAARVPTEGLAGRRILWARTDNNPPADASAELEALRTLGVSVEHWSSEDPDLAEPRLGRHIDQWILSEMPTMVSSH